MKTGLSSDRTATQAANFLSAMANAKRLHILGIIAQAEMPVGQLAEMVNLSQSALSQHLSKLRNAKLVTTRRDAQTIYYSCTSSAAIQLLASINDIFEMPDGPTANIAVA